MGTELPDRKGNRLKGYDYSARGVYFVTICTQNRVCNLGSVVGADARIGPHDGLNPDVHIELSPLGRIAEQALLQMDGLLHYVIMPNHIHFLVGIQPKADGTMQASSPTNISQIVRIFKGRVAHRAGHSVFQRSFYDHIGQPRLYSTVIFLHIIRTETDYWAIVQYIDENPLKWVLDPLYQEGTP